MTSKHQVTQHTCGLHLHLYSPINHSSGNDICCSNFGTVAKDQVCSISLSHILADPSKCVVYYRGLGWTKFLSDLLLGDGTAACTCCEFLVPIDREKKGGIWQARYHPPYRVWGVPYDTGVQCDIWNLRNNIIISATNHMTTFSPSKPSMAAGRKHL